MWHEEEVELAVDHFTLFNKALVDVGALRGVVNEGRALLARGLLEEALADALVHNDQGDLGWRHSLCFIIFEQTVFFLHDLVELFQFILNYLSAHRISNTVTVNKNVFWHRLVVITVALEGALEVITEYCARNNFLTLLWLGARLRVIFAQVGVKCCTEANRALFTLVAHVNTDEHGLL